MHTHCGCLSLSHFVCCLWENTKLQTVILSLFIFKSGAFVVLLVLLCCIHHHTRKLNSKLSLFVSHYVTWPKRVSISHSAESTAHNWISVSNLSGIKRLFWQTSHRQAGRLCGLRLKPSIFDLFELTSSTNFLVFLSSRIFSILAQFEYRSSAFLI